MNLLSILLQAAAEGSQWSGIVMMVVIVAIFYFFMIRPQSKKQKEIKKFREGLSKGDKIITAGGIHGTIKEIRENCFVVEISDNVKIRIDKNSVYPSAEDAAMSQEKK